jgi:hypothetical protein
MGDRGREASWSAPVLWRFRPRTDRKSGSGLPQSKTLRAHKPNRHFLARYTLVGDSHSHPLQRGVNENCAGTGRNLSCALPRAAAASVLAFQSRGGQSWGVDATDQPVVLTAAQAQTLKRQLATMRREINNRLSLIVAAAEIMRRRPHLTPKMLPTFVEQPAKITAFVEEFSGHFERALGLTRRQPLDLSQSG